MKSLAFAITTTSCASPSPETAAPGRKFDFVVRAFNDGIGFRYEVPARPALGDFVISDELTEFTLADNAEPGGFPPTVRGSTARSCSTRRRR